MLTRLTTNMSFDDFALATIDVAGELHGSGSAIQRAVVAAWRRVGLPSFVGPADVPLCALIHQQLTNREERTSS